MAKSTREIRECKTHGLTEHYIYDNGSKDGAARCRECALARKKDKKVKEYDRQWAKNNPERMKELSAKHIAKAKEEGKKKKTKLYDDLKPAVDKLMQVFGFKEGERDIMRKIKPHLSYKENLKNIEAFLRKSAISEKTNTNRWNLIPIYLWKHRKKYSKFSEFPKELKDKLYKEGRTKAIKEVNEIEISLDSLPSKGKFYPNDTKITMTEL